MSLQDLAPVNSKRAQQIAINAFSRFLVVEGVNMQFIAATFLGRFVKLMDRIAIHLTSAEGREGKVLARNSVMSYCRHVKNWLLDTYPKNRVSIKKKTSQDDQTLERHCPKRFEGGATKRAPAYSKENLRILLDGLYFDAASYQDAALLALMWYAFGRPSDLGFVAKSNLTVSADEVVFVRLARVKTSQEQGISVFPDQVSFVPCPLYAIGMVLVMQDTPSSRLLDHPQLATEDEERTVTPIDIPLAEALT
ncbi:hypothetical protein PHMEG_0003057 [Phytophthora megakarya]|uniref:Uncharacterized protein n=1 Tax=Phytophthora megakarya TaxID=4795 RepID=A0A225WZ57_9STRA|nr:hypothetical protein PHMEG_0003057 [Phytophthora megakarya]